MGVTPRLGSGEIDIADCIKRIEGVRDECDAAGFRMVGIHLTEAIDALEREMGTTYKGSA